MKNAINNFLNECIIREDRVKFLLTNKNFIPESLFKEMLKEELYNEQDDDNLLNENLKILIDRLFNLNIGCITEYTTFLSKTELLKRLKDVTQNFVYLRVFSLKLAGVTLKENINYIFYDNKKIFKVILKQRKTKLKKTIKIFFKYYSLVTGSNKEILNVTNSFLKFAEEINMPKEDINSICLYLFKIFSKRRFYQNAIPFEMIQNINQDKLSEEEQIKLKKIILNKNI